MILFPATSVRKLTPLLLCLLLAQGNGIAQEGQDELAEIVLPRAAPDEYPEEEAGEPGLNPDLLIRQPASIEDRLQNLFKLYRDAMDDGMFAEADTLAKQIVELTIEANGLDSPVAARAITNLAIAQHGAEDYASAELNFTSAIEIVERISDRLNEALINPLKGLAATQFAQGKTGEAANTYQHAMHISHVNYGPHNLQQIEVLESLAETLLAAGEFDEATDMQERILTLQSRNVARDSEELLPALISQARWLHRLGLFEKERFIWRRVISIVEENRGKDDISLISPLTELGKSYLYVGIDASAYTLPAAASTGEIYLKRAMRIAERNPAADWDVETQAMIELGDYYLLTGRPSRAERMYRNAWNIYSDDDARLAKRVEQLQSLQVIQAIEAPKIYGSSAQNLPPRATRNMQTGSLEFQYTVGARGTASKIELVDAEPAGLDDMESRVRREIRRIVHRPRMEDGQMRSTDAVRLTHTFYYDPGDLPQSAESVEELVSND